MRKIPTLRSESLKPSAFAHSTCWEAGWLTTKNAGWRSKRPVIDVDKCKSCMRCFNDCPDGTIYRIENDKVAVDYDFCKGCGMCAVACKFDAICMVDEH